MALLEAALNCALASFLAAAPVDPRNHALFLMQTGQTEEAISLYQTAPRPDFETLQQMGHVLFERGIQDPDPEVFLLSLFGAGFSNSLTSVDILEKGLRHPSPEMQMIAVRFIGQHPDDRCDLLLNEAMSSDFLSTRMEAAYYLSMRKHPHAVGQIEGLLFRLPPPFRPYFPSLFALIGTHDATLTLKRLLDDPDPSVRVEVILQVAAHNRDDFLPLLRRRLAYAHMAELEAAIYAIGRLLDTTSLPRLQKLSAHPAENVRMAALIACVQLGDRSGIPSLETLARKGNLFAINALSQISGTEEALAPLLLHPDLHVRTNVALALLLRRDARALPFIEQLLLPDTRDFAFHPIGTPGRTLMAWKTVPSAEQRASDPTLDLSLTPSFRAFLLQEALQLPVEPFLKLARACLREEAHELIPLLISHLENLQSPQAIALLEEGTCRLGSPLIRTYCHLALYRLRHEGPHREFLSEWVLAQHDTHLIRLKPPEPWTSHLAQSEFSLTQEETSRLLLESFLAIASRQDEESIHLLLDAIRTGHPHNRYPLFGLLMRATE